MQILLTNDDGVQAPGLWVLRDALEALGCVTVVAPRTEQSGVGHSVTYHRPITAEQVNLSGGRVAYAVEGTPADCAKFGLFRVFQGPPDLLVSGINGGLNLGPNVFSSGTVAAAMEGAIRGVMSVAVSCPPENFEQPALTAGQALRALRAILETPGPGPAAYNVNLPLLNGVDPEIRFTHHCEAPLPERYRREDGPEGAEVGFQLDYDPDADQPRPPTGCDVAAVTEGMISVTPLRVNLTDMDYLRRRRGPQAEE